MVSVHTLEVFPTVDELNAAVGRAFFERLRTLINEAGTDVRINVAISGGAITTSFCPPCYRVSTRLTGRAFACGWWMNAMFRRR